MDLKSFGYKEIIKHIPHRYPFLLVDKIISLDLEKGVIEGQKNVTINEPFFQGHFPNNPIMPGVLILEALAQTAGVIIGQKTDSVKIAVLLNIKNAKFRSPVKPGDTLHLRCEEIHISKVGARFQCVATVDGKVAVEAEMAFAGIDEKQI